MGRWSLENITIFATNRTSAEVFGHNVHALFRMRYDASRLSRFHETPRLVWHEHIICMEIRRRPSPAGDAAGADVITSVAAHTEESRTWWEVSVDQYARNPGSPNFAPWIARYREGYRSAVGMPGSVIRGGAQLFHRRGGDANPRTQNVNTADDQAEASRRYLGKKGGILTIEIHDVPSIGLSGEWDVKERYLFFTLGVQGGTVWRRVRQHLRVDKSLPPDLWTRTLEVEPLEPGVQPAWETNVDTTGFTRVDPPAHLTQVNQPLLVGGEFV
ncbi:hypothetical protein [Polyangium sp. 6x1]|uniref:hypothetical protein n=1 Tax=Polyangium sp. 6x1 TaxID=3042689 RepID=UPI0024827144|nr:hypothetical protein [Polyangium sp. 6x1]MDI1444689.1 hypothetical protein [Polyangium sp. 6x1]